MLLCALKLMPLMRTGAVIVRLTDGRVLLHGGADPASGRLFDDVWVLSMESLSWTQMQCEGLVARHAFQGVLLPCGSILFIGGSNKDGPTWQPQLLQLDGSTCTIASVAIPR